MEILESGKKGDYVVRLLEGKIREGRVMEEREILKREGKSRDKYWQEGREGMK